MKKSINIICQMWHTEKVRMFKNLAQLCQVVNEVKDNIKKQSGQDINLDLVFSLNYYPAETFSAPAISSTGIITNIDKTHTIHCIDGLKVGCFMGHIYTPKTAEDNFIWSFSQVKATNDAFEKVSYHDVQKLAAEILEHGFQAAAKNDWAVIA